MLNKSFICGFPPILCDRPKVLILGTMPSVQSLQNQFYYAHPRNAFWPIIAHLSGLSLNNESDKRQACELLGIMVWDVLASCQRSGSLDSAIKQPQANDFVTCFQSYPSIEAIFFNGQSAAKLFKQQVVAKGFLPKHLHWCTLPSTSPANARLKISDKLLIWEEKIRPFL
ncbi:MAG: DNA-deoxyinosine glycosylase [Thiotrichales bacterium]|nr:DNA-deoxyinosine glycosylase [Thiotrichales bacterium]